LLSGDVKRGTNGANDMYFGFSYYTPVNSKAGYAQASLQSGVALVIMLGIMVWQAGRRPIGTDEDTV